MAGKATAKALIVKKGAKIPGSPPRTGGVDRTAVLFLGTSLFLLFCLISYDPRDPSFNVATGRAQVQNLCGLVGSHVADGLVQLLGMASLLIPAGLVFLALRMLIAPIRPSKWAQFGSILGIVCMVSILAERFGIGPLLSFPLTHPGGALGSFGHTRAFRFLGSAGELVLAATVLLLCVGNLFRTSVRRMAQVAYAAASIAVIGLVAARNGMRRRAEERRLEEEAMYQPPAEVKASAGLPACAGVNAETGRIVKCELEDIRSWERLSFLPKEGENGVFVLKELTIEDGRPDPLEFESKEILGMVPMEAFPWKSFDMVKEPPPFGETEPHSRRVRIRSMGDENLTSEDVQALTGRGIDLPQPGEDVSPSGADLHLPGQAVAISWREGAGDDEQEASPVLTTDLTCHELEAAIEEFLQQEQQDGGDSPGAPEMSRQAVRDEAPANGRVTPKGARASATCEPLPLTPPEPADGEHEQLRPIRVTRRADEEIAPKRVAAGAGQQVDDYRLPPADLLDTPPDANRAIDEKLLERNAAIVEQKLADLGIKGEVVEIHPGPVITMYEINLASGIPLRRVLNTADDLAMALKSGSTRVVAPIPGKDTVGIEVPNLHREIVYFREIIESPAFMDSTSPLKMALGKGIDGEPFATSLARMPHLLIAGATGTGKSVGLNCLICSLLMSAPPEELKFIMVDPKRLELSYYQDIPHLIHPVVTEAEKVPRVLNWAIREMERRYELLSRAGAKNIEGFNAQVRRGEIVAGPDDQPVETLPYLVIIVDELAELMMVAAKDIEISIARLAQMARAAGIHLVLATQRPSVDVITGVIKANFPARVSYQVSAKPDSRTILDTVGAEHLLGMGDMLFLPPGTAKLVRLHGAYVSENEIRRIVDFIKEQRGPVYLQEITKIVAEGDSKSPASDLIEDVKYDQAVELVTRLGHASISLIQRHMRIGYNRAARIIEAMEAEGLIGPSDGTSRPREVLGRSLESIPDGPA